MGNVEVNEYRNEQNTHTHILFWLEGGHQEDDFGWQEQQKMMIKTAVKRIY